MASSERGCECGHHRSLSLCNLIMHKKITQVISKVMNMVVANFFCFDPLGNKYVGE